jgi:uncharacterized protein (DUF1800 family)
MIRVRRSSPPNSGEPSLSRPNVVEGFATVEAAYGELDAMIEMMFAQAETARFIARKLYRFFVPIISSLQRLKRTLSLPWPRN